MKCNLILLNKIYVHFGKDLLQSFAVNFPLQEICILIILLIFFISLKVRAWYTEDSSLKGNFLGVTHQGVSKYGLVVKLLDSQSRGPAFKTKRYIMGGSKTIAKSLLKSAPRGPLWASWNGTCATSEYNIHFRWCDVLAERVEVTRN